MTKTKKTNILTCIFSVLLVSFLAITALLAPSPTVKADSARLGFNADGTLDVETISKWQETTIDFADGPEKIGGRFLKIEIDESAAKDSDGFFGSEYTIVNFNQPTGSPFGAAVSPLFAIGVDIETGAVSLPIFQGLENQDLVSKAIKTAYLDGYLYVFFTDEPIELDSGDTTTSFENLETELVTVGGESVCIMALEPSAEQETEKDKTELGDIAKDSADKLAGWFSENTGFAISGGAIIAFVIAAIVWGKLSKK